MVLALSMYVSYNWFYVIITNGSYEWFLQMVLTNGSYEWFLRMVLTNGSYEWFLRMVLMNGSYEWFLRMVLTNGSYEWFSVDELSVWVVESVCVPFDILPHDFAVRVKGQMGEGCRGRCV
jgi:hypothetical protein